MRPVKSRYLRQDLRRAQFSRPQILIFAIAFGLIGFLIFKSFAAPNPNLPGDLNNDNTVNITDLSILLTNYGTTNATADINGDGQVSILDLSILLSHYGQSITTSKPVAPTGLTATAGDTSVALSWTANPASDSVDTYQVYWTTDVNWGSNQSNLNVTGTNYTVTGLTNGTTYYFRVSAHNLAGYGPWSTTPVSATPQTSGGGGGTGTLIKFGSFDTGNLSEFSDATCNPQDVSVNVSGGPNNTSWARYAGTTSAQCYGDTSNIRIHSLGLPGGSPSWFNNGGTAWEAVSLRIPSGYSNANNTNDGLYAGPEVHGDNGTGPAPFNLTADDGYWIIRVRGSGYATANPAGGFPFAQNQFGPNPGSSNLYEGQYYRRWQDWAGGNHAVVPGEWVHFRLGFHFDDTLNSSGVGAGWFEAWARWGSMTSWVNIVPRVSNIPTSYVDVSGDGSAIYPMLSLYRPTSGASGTYAIDYADGAWSNDLTTLTNWQNGRLGF